MAAAWFRVSGSKAPDFNGPVDVPFHPFADEWMEVPIATLFQRAVAQHGERVALVNSRHRLTYAAVGARVEALARRIAAHGHAAPVGIMLLQDLSFPIAALACLTAGVPYIPIDLKYPAARIVSILEDAGSSLVITERDQPAPVGLPTGVKQVALDSSGRLVEENGPAAELPPALGVDEPAIILYTSGSTGRPKGICNHQRALLQRVAEATNSSHLNSSDRALLLSSPGTIAGEREMFAALLNGGSLTLCDPQRDGLSGVLKIFSEREITVCYIVPALLRMLLRAPGAGQALSHLRVLRIGGDITLSSDLELFRRVAPPDCHFLASFSATEMPAVFQWFVPRDWQPDGPRVPVGYPRPEVELRTLDENGDPAPAGEFAELVVKSRYLALGQWQEGRLQSGALQVDADDPRQRILRIGDLVRERPDGLWELAGRRDRQVKIHGQRIDTGELEAVLRGHVEVDDVAVLARREGEETVALVAFVASAKGQAGLVDELRGLIAARLPAYMRPAQIHRLPAIPQLPGFKPDMAALQKLDQDWREQQRREQEQRAQDHQAQEASRKLRRWGSIWPARNAAPSANESITADVQSAVRGAWTKVLGADSYRQDQPFDVSGGDSLKALELWFHIEEALGYKLGLDAMGRASRPSELERALVREICNPAVKMAAFQDKPGVPLIYLVPGILGDDPLQLRFRAAFGDSVRFKLIDYPPWRETMESNCSFDVIIDAAFRQICADPPQEVYRLAGYSYGGIVAFELARRLVESGRRVDMLALLDARRWDVAQTRPLWEQDEMLPETGPVARALAASITIMVRARMYPLLAFACTMLTRHANRLAFRFRNRMTKDLRFEALRKWRARYLSVPITLFVSNTRWPGEPQGYGWQDLAPSINVVYIGGTHASMIDKPGREAIAVHIRNALGSGMPFAQA